MNETEQQRACLAVGSVAGIFFFSSRRRHTRFDCDWSSDVCFFASRRRHTRFDCDWSSDVCSSDLEWPFEIGLWVGKAATPNVLGYKGYKGSGDARAKVRQFKADPKGKPSPIPLDRKSVV